MCDEGTELCRNIVGYTRMIRVMRLAGWYCLHVCLSLLVRDLDVTLQMHTLYCRSGYLQSRMTGHAYAT